MIDIRFKFPLVLALACVPVGSLTVFAQGVSQEDFLAMGRDLFEREWKPGEPASPGGDGLGPNFNDVSCIGCHNQGGKEPHRVAQQDLVAQQATFSTTWYIERCDGPSFEGSQWPSPWKFGTTEETDGLYPFQQIEDRISISLLVWGWA